MVYRWHRYQHPLISWLWLASAASLWVPGLGAPLWSTFSSSEKSRTVIRTTSPPSLRICMSVYLCWISSINTCLATKVIVALWEAPAHSDPKLDPQFSTVVIIWIGLITKPLPSNDREVNEIPVWLLDLQLWCVLIWTQINCFISHDEDSIRLCTYFSNVNKWIHTVQRNHSFIRKIYRIFHLSLLTYSVLLWIWRHKLFAQDKLQALITLFKSR